MTGRRGRDDRLADRAAGAALAARRQSREGPHPVPVAPPPSSAARTAFWSRILDPALRHPVSRRSLSAALLLAMAVPVLQHAHRAVRLDSLPRSAPTVETLDRCRRRSPARRCRPWSPSRPTRTARPSSTRSLELRGRRPQAAQHDGPSRSTPTRRTPSPGSTIPLAGNGVDATSTRALDELRNKHPAGARSARCRAPTTQSPAAPRRRTTGTR